MAAATETAAQVLTELGTASSGLSADEADLRLRRDGANAVRTHGVTALAVLWRQLNSPLLLLLAVTATVAFVLGDRTDAAVIGSILVISVGVGFANEYRAERTAASASAAADGSTVMVPASPSSIST